MGSSGIAAAFIVVGLALFCVASSVHGEPGNNPSVKLNPLALAYAKELIKNEHVVLDRKGAWAKDRPSTEPESEFIRQHGFVDYAKWWLAIDEPMLRTPNGDTNFPMAISKTFIAAHCLQSRAVLGNTAIPRSKPQRQN